VTQILKAIAFWVLIVLCGVLLWKVVQTGGLGAKVPEITFSTFMQSVDRGEIYEVTISGTEVYGKYKTAFGGFRTTIPANYPELFDHLRDRGVTISIKENSTGWQNILLNLSPLILFAALWFVMVRGIQRSVRKKDRFTYEAVTAADLPKALEKANEMSREGWRAVSISVGNSSSSPVVVLMER
jgi:cell division protease FtsH